GNDARRMLPRGRGDPRRILALHTADAEQHDLDDVVTLHRLDVRVDRAGIREMCVRVEHRSAIVGENGSHGEPRDHQRRDDGTDDGRTRWHAAHRIGDGPRVHGVEAYQPEDITGPKSRGATGAPPWENRVGRSGTPRMPHGILSKEEAMPDKTYK